MTCCAGFAIGGGKRESFAPKRAAYMCHGAPPDKLTARKDRHEKPTSQGSVFVCEGLARLCVTDWRMSSGTRAMTDDEQMAIIAVNGGSLRR